jgi:hypothetical protein
MKSRAYYLIRAAQTVAVLLTFWTLFLSAFFLGAERPDEVPESVAASLPPNCTAVLVNHGEYSCFSLGTFRTNPWGFVASIIVLVGSIVFLRLTFRRNQPE